MTEEGLVDTQLPVAISICLALVCALGSAVFSGLTLGLLTLDLVQLKLVIDRPKESRADEVNSRYAKRILPLRKDGNYLLVTLLTANVAVNAGFSLLLGGLTDGLVGFLVSTVVITIFGEILPQAICARHGLKVGGNLACFVWGLEWLLYPVVKPIAVALNLLLGEDLGTIYDRKQLRALVEYHDNVVHVLTSDEARILKGGLEFAFVRVDKVMTPIERVCGLEIDTKLTFERISKILSCGYSRIPVLDFSSPQCIVGLLYMKDLALFDPYAEVEVRTLLHLFGRNVYAVDDDTALLDLLTAFKKGHTHLAVVRSVECTGDGDPYYRHVGIITLEDIIEEILQDEIHDEFDHEKQQHTEPATPSSTREGKAVVGGEQAPLLKDGTEVQRHENGNLEDSNLPTGASSSIVIPMGGVLKPSAEEAPPPQAATAQHQRKVNRSGKHWANCDDCNRSQLLGCGVSKALAADRRPLKMISHVFSDYSPAKKFGHPVDEHTILRGRMKLIDKSRVGDCLSRSEAVAVSTFLSCAERCFQPPNVSPLLLLVLLQQMRPIRIGSGVEIFKRGSRAYHAALVLQGRLKLEVGCERIACRVGPWTTLAMHGLNMKPLPEEFLTKREKLQQTIGSRDLSSYGDIPAFDPAFLADAPTAGSCGCNCMTCSTEGDAGGGALHFRTAALHGYCAQHAVATSFSGSSSGCVLSAKDSMRHPVSLYEAASSFCGSSEPGTSLLRSASPRCFSALQAPPLQHPAGEYLLACECKNPKCQDAASANAAMDGCAQLPVSPTHKAWRSQNHRASLTPLITSNDCTGLDSDCAGCERQKAETSSTGRQRTGLATGGVPASASSPADATPLAAPCNRLNPPVVPPRAEDDETKATAPAAACRTEMSPASPMGPRIVNLRIEGSAAPASPSSSSRATSPDSVGRRVALPLPEAKRRDVRSASRAAATAALVGKEGGRRLTGGKANAVIAGSSSSSGSEGKKPGNESNRLFFGLLHGRPRGYRELKRRSSKAVSPSSFEISPAGIYTSWAPEPSNDPKDSPAGAVRRSASSRSSRGAAAATLDGTENAEEDGSSSSCSPDSSCTDASNNPSKAMREQRTLQRAPMDADTAQTDRMSAPSLMREALHGVTLPPTLARGYLREEDTSQQPSRLQHFRQGVMTKYHPLQVTSAAAAAGDKVQGAPESSAKVNTPVGAPGGPSTSYPSHSFTQQLEAQDTQLRDFMRQLSTSANNPTLQQLLNDSGWSQEDLARVDSFFDSVAEDSVYYPDFSSRTDGDCQLLMIPQWLYFYAVKTSLIHPVFVASTQRKLCARRLEGRPCQC